MVTNSIGHFRGPYKWYIWRLKGQKIPPTWQYSTFETQLAKEANKSFFASLHQTGHYPLLPHLPGYYKLQACYYSSIYGYCCKEEIEGGRQALFKSSANPSVPFSLYLSRWGHAEEKLSSAAFYCVCMIYASMTFYNQESCSCRPNHASLLTKKKIVLQLGMLLISSPFPLD